MDESLPQHVGSVIGEDERQAARSRGDVSASASTSHASDNRRTSLVESPPTFAPVYLTAARPAKIAIPRQRSAVASRQSRRVPRACESCRLRKTKCSGDTPACRQCRELRATCIYPPGVRERMKKYVPTDSYSRSEALIHAVTTFLDLLRDYLRLNRPH